MQPRCVLVTLGLGKPRRTVGAVASSIDAPRGLDVPVCVHADSSWCENLRKHADSHLLENLHIRGFQFVSKTTCTNVREHHCQLLYKSAYARFSVLAKIDPLRNVLGVTIASWRELPNVN